MPPVFELPLLADKSDRVRSALDLLFKKLMQAQAQYRVCTLSVVPTAELLMFGVCQER